MFLHSSNRPAKSHRAVALLGGLLLGAATRPLTAQAPFAAQTLRAGQLQLQAQTQGYAANAGSGGWIWLLPAVAVGLPARVEVTAGASIIRPRPIGSAPVDLTVGTKWQVLADTARGSAIAVGALAFLPTSPRAIEGVTPDRYGFAYIAANQALPFTWGTGESRLTPQLSLAGFHTVGRDRWVRDAVGEALTGVAVGLDQLLPTSWSRNLGLTGPDDGLLLSANWVTGNSAFGYATAGVTVGIGRQAWSLSYARGNRPERNHGPSLAYAITF